MSTADEKEFMSITGKSQVEARQFLQMANGNLEEAISLAFDEPSVQNNTPTQPPPPPKPENPWKNLNVNKPKHRSMSDILKENEDGENNKARTNYSGDEHSGILTIANDGKGKNDDPVAQLFNKAKVVKHDDDDNENGHPPPKKPVDPNAWKSGGGKRMDGTESQPPSQPKATESNSNKRFGGGGFGGGGAGVGGGFGGFKGNQGQGAKAGGGVERLNIVITFYKQGFQVGENGKFIRNDNPKYNEYLQTMMRNQFPPDLAPAEMKPGQGVSIMLHDNKEEMFKEPPPPPPDPFAGKGHTISSSSPSSSAPSKSTPKFVFPQDTPKQDFSELAGKSEFQVACRVEGGGSGGGQLRVTMGEGSTLKDLEGKLKSLLSVGKFQLIQPYPRKVFGGDDYAKTLTDLGLKNAAIIVKT